MRATQTSNVLVSKTSSQELLVLPANPTWRRQKLHDIGHGGSGIKNGQGPQLGQAEVSAQVHWTVEEKEPAKVGRSYGVS